MSRLSGVQQDVLSLYRRVLREAVKKDRREIVAASDAVVNGDTNSAVARPAKSVSFTALLFTKPNVGHPQSSSAAVPASSLPNESPQSMIRHDVATTATVTSFASQEFRRQAAAVKRSDFKKVEYLIRKGDKQIKLLQMPGVKLVSGTSSVA